MTVEYNGKEIELKYTFNSFLYMENFDLSELQNIENKPFKVLSVTRELLMGAINHNPNDPHSIIVANDILEKSVSEGEIITLLEVLMDELEESDFFKGLLKVDKK